MEVKSKTGFALMSPEQRRAAQSAGGKKVHALGVAHVFTSENARDAGRKGGLVTSKNTAHMSAIGRKGGSVKRNKQIVDG